MDEAVVTSKHGLGPHCTSSASTVMSPRTQPLPSRPSLPLASHALIHEPGRRAGPLLVRRAAPPEGAEQEPQVRRHQFEPRQHQPGHLIPGPWFCYGVTKVAPNYLVRRVHVENDWLTTVALQPGWEQTEMGNFAAKAVCMESTPMKLKESVEGCWKVIDASSREKYTGKFVSRETNRGRGR